MLLLVENDMGVWLDAEEQQFISANVMTTRSHHPMNDN